MTPWTAVHQASLSFTISRSLRKLMFIESVKLTISSTVTHFYSCLQSFPASGSFLVSWLFTSGGQSIGASVQFSSVSQLCPTLCDPMNCSMPGLPVHHQLPEFTQTHVHRVSDAIQSSHPLSSTSPPAPNASQQQSLFQ